MLPPPSTPRGDDRWRARRGTARSARRGRCRLTPERVAAELRMPRNTPQTADASSAVAFEVDRFAWTASDRIEVTGRWFGLRGHRFMRPSLIVEAGEDRRRLLALLEHKPWAANDGEPWIAAFAWAGDPVAMTFAELSVAPSVAVELPPPPAPGARARSSTRRAAEKPRTGPRIRAGEATRGDTLERDLARAREELERLRAEHERERPAAREEAAALRAELSGAGGGIEALGAAAPPEPEAAPASEAQPAGDTADRLAELSAERDALAADLRKARTRADDLRRERDAARAAAAESPDEADAARRERDAAVAERDEAREEASRERRALERRIEAAERRFAEAAEERDATGRDRDTLRSQRDEAIARLDAAMAARERAREERAAAERARDEAFEARDAAQAVAQASAFDRAAGSAPRSRTAPAGPRRSPLALWAPRLFALAVLLVAFLVVWTTLRGVL